MGLILPVFSPLDELKTLTGPAKKNTHQVERGQLPGVLPGNRTIGVAKSWLRVSQVLSGVRFLP